MKSLILFFIAIGGAWFMGYLLYVLWNIFKWIFFPRYKIPAPNLTPDNNKTNVS